MTISDEFIHSLKMANPIEDVMSSYVSLKRQGGNRVCNCPFHSEKTPSCTVFPSQQHFYCFGCQTGGDVITFIMKIENLDFVEAVEFLAKRAGMEIPEQNGQEKYNSERRTRIYEMNRLSANYFYLCLVKGQNKAGINYFRHRQIAPQTIKKYGLGYSPDSWDSLANYLHSKGYNDDEISSAWLGSFGKNGRLYDIFRNRVMFPIVDLRGNVIGFGGRVLDDSKPKYLNTSETPVFDKGNNLFSLNFAKKSDSKKLILCEGYMDVIALNQAGFDNAVATLGTAITPEQARIMSRCAEEIVVAYDSDSAGQNAARKAIKHLSDVGVKTKILRMEGAKDPDEYIKKFGRERFRKLIDDSSDAVKYMLRQCENDIDLSTETGKIDYLRRTSDILAEIPSKVERQVYISTVSAKCGISPGIFNDHIDNMLRNKNKIRKKNQWRSIKTETTFHRDTINPDSEKNHKEAIAEESIICYILKSPEDAGKISEMIPPEYFVTSFNKKVYSALLGKIKTSENFDISLMHEEFSPDEFGKITGITVNSMYKDMSTKYIQDCAETLKEYNSTHTQDSEISNEELRSLFKSKK